MANNETLTSIIRIRSVTAYANAIYQSFFINQLIQKEKILQSKRKKAKQVQKKFMHEF